ncbi:MAG: tRNA (cytidine(56)-2'-O)-methyltransferase [Methanomicrobiales archaeon]|nr:tRNA (cytidine(56)-2'-O)-methyltransferase [Methanomicrobiales archaeon]
MPAVVVLRVGHRPERDQRVTTHVGLAARALGARGMYLAADDPGVVRSIRDVVSRWGGDFFVEDGVKWRQCIRDWKAGGGRVVHLTMYGLRMTDIIDDIRDVDQVLVVVGAGKVPGDIYGLADYNVSVTTQPHSEISSLALFLDHLFLGSELNREYPDAGIRIEPAGAGKRTVER